MIAEMLNPPRRLAGDTYQSRPVPLELLFLIAGAHPDPATRLALVGRFIQVIDDFPVSPAACRPTTWPAVTRLPRRPTPPPDRVDRAVVLARRPVPSGGPVRMQVCLLDSQLPSEQVLPVLHRRAQIDQLIGVLMQVAG